MYGTVREDCHDRGCYIRVVSERLEAWRAGGIQCCRIEASPGCTAHVALRYLREAWKPWISTLGGRVAARPITELAASLL
jgi:hypothetical protein